MCVQHVNVCGNGSTCVNPTEDGEGQAETMREEGDFQPCTEIVVNNRNSCENPTRYDSSDDPCSDCKRRDNGQQSIPLRSYEERMSNPTLLLTREQQDQLNWIRTNSSPEQIIEAKNSLISEYRSMGLERLRPTLVVDQDGKVVIFEVGQSTAGRVPRSSASDPEHVASSNTSGSSSTQAGAPAAASSKDGSRDPRSTSYNGTA